MESNQIVNPLKLNARTNLYKILIKGFLHEKSSIKHGVSIRIQSYCLNTCNYLLSKILTEKYHISEFEKPHRPITSYFNEITHICNILQPRMLNLLRCYKQETFILLRNCCKWKTAKNHYQKVDFCLLV